MAGIESEHYPLKLTNGRRQSSADLHMVIDIIDTVLDRPQVKTFLLMYRRPRLHSDRGPPAKPVRQERRHQRCPGLAEPRSGPAGHIDDPLEVASVYDRDKALIRKIDYYEVTRHEGFYPTFSNLSRFLQHPVNHQMIDPNFVQAKLSQFVTDAVLEREVIMT